MDNEFERIFNEAFPDFKPGKDLSVYGIQVSESDSERYAAISTVMDESYADNTVTEPTNDAYFFLR